MSLVAFIGVALFCFGKQVLDYGRTISNAQSICYQIYQDESGKCVDSSEGFKTCTDNASASLHQCSFVNRPTTKTRIEEYSIEALLSLFAGYLVLLLIRTLGWVAAGFKKEKPLT